MNIELAFFDGDNLLCRGEITCEAQISSSVFSSPEGYIFEIEHSFEEPACPLQVVCSQNGTNLYKAALRVGVHHSDDWEVISLGDIHDLGFRCVPAM